MKRPWNPDLSLHGRIGISLAAGGAFLLAVVGLSVVLLIQTQNTQSDVIDHYYGALRTSQNYFVGMLDSDTAVRGYALSNGDASTLDPLNQAGRPWEHPIDAQVATALPEQTAALQALRRTQDAAVTWYEQWAAPVIEHTSSGQTTTPEEVERGRALFSTFRTSYTTYIDALRTERADAADHLQVLTNLLFDTSLAAALLAIATCLILWWLLRGWVSRPVASLAKEAQVVRGGDLSHEVRVSGPKEFVQLGEAVEAMRAQLVSQIAAVESTRREVVDAQGQLETQADELQRSNRELEQFAYVASHDLQEPLRKVASFCQLLQRRYADQLDERANQYIHFAVDGARRMQQLINDLLDFSRVGRLSSSPATDVDTAVCLRAALSNVETARTESGATVDIQATMPVVPGEAPLLTQLFQNLISNAIKFRTDAPPVIKIGAMRVGTQWEFWCSDNGIGIPPEYADRVFLIFQRLHAKEQYEGTGIGLAMCQKIVEYHSGRIWVDTAAGGSPSTGTTIRWTLPGEAVPLAPAPDLVTSPA